MIDVLAYAIVIAAICVACLIIYHSPELFGLVAMGVLIGLLILACWAIEWAVFHLVGGRA